MSYKYLLNLFYNCHNLPQARRDFIAVRMLETMTRSDLPAWRQLLVNGLAARVVLISSAAALCVSGGGPLDHYEPLSLFLKALKSADFSVFMWTGFEMNEVKSHFAKILKWLDCIMVGPYLEHKRIRTVPFVSNSHQEIHCLTARAAKDWVNFDRA